MNVHRHANSRNAVVRVRCSDGEACVEVADAGCGFHPDHGGFVPLGMGVEGMRERVRGRACGRCLDVESGCAGTTVRATVRAAPSGARSTGANDLIRSSSGGGSGT